MFHFDSQAGVLAQNQVTIPIQPSGMAIIVGTHLNDPEHPDDRKYSLAILDEDDKLLRSVDLPLPPGGGGLLLVHAWVVGDGVAYGMLHSDQPPQTAIGEGVQLKVRVNF